MAITIIDRPSKELTNGFLSKWASSELPLQYTIESDLYPINKVDTPNTITNLVYNSAELGVVLTIGGHDFGAFDTITVNGTGTQLDEANFSIKKVTTNTVVLDFKTDETTTTGTTLPYYNNYKGLIKVFSGAPDQHIYNTDLSKPNREIGTIEVDFKNDGTNNVGRANVNAYIKADITAQFDDAENTHYGWTSFYVQYAESYDTSDGSNITNLTTPFSYDETATCDPFTDFVDSSFNNGLTDWLQDGTSDFTGGVGLVNYTGQLSSYLYQNKVLRGSITYNLSVDVNANVLGDENRAVVLFYGYDGIKWKLLTYDFITVTGVSNVEVDVTPFFNIERVAVVLQTASNNPNIPGDINVDLLDFNVSTSNTNTCLFFQFANFGTKQFQDELGGNFGDYVLNIVDTITPKMLTHFESKSYFYGKPFFISAIIPTSTFSLSEEANNLFLDVALFKGNNVVHTFRYKVENLNDGVYTVDPNIKAQLDDNNIPFDSWDSGTSQFTIIPGNTFTDGDNGTFETGVNGFTMVFATPQEVGDQINQSSIGQGRTGDYSAGVTTSKATMNEVDKEYKILDTDTEINVSENRDYVVTYYFSFVAGAQQPDHIDNGSLYLLPSTHSKEECLVNSILLSNENSSIVNDPMKWVECSTQFTAKTTGVLTLSMFELLQTDINVGSGIAVSVDDITFKGPIEYLSEVKPITNDVECTLYGGTLRWLNDLNGWESFYFSKKAITRETVSGKIDIIRDYTTNWDSDFINGDTTNDTIKTTATKSVTLHSQLLTRNQHQNLQQIKRSARVQMLMEDGKWQTVTTKKTNYEIDNEREDIFEMAITVLLPNVNVQKQ